MNDIDLVLPVLDEAEALPWVLARVPSGVRPIVVDNGSTDGSADIARALGATVVIEQQRGFGAACAAGLAHAEAELVAFCDADASIDPTHVVAIAELLRTGHADLVLGARHTTERGAWPVHARFANRYLAWRVRRHTGAALTDIGPLRIARREALVGLDLRDRRFGWSLEMVVRAAQAGWAIRETPVPYRPRVGRSKVTGTLSGTVAAIRDMRVVLATLDQGSP
ncbi:MAG: glycosyltransferase family 2 protein [Actinomycetota bacterium]